MNLLITGATGNLGKSVLKNLKGKFPLENIYGLIRDENKISEIEEFGIKARVGNYLDANSLEKAFSGIDILYFISSSDLQDRFSQHKNVIDSAKKAGIKYIIYTSFDRIDSENSALGMINNDHKKTEDYIKSSGINYTILLHGLYMEVIPDFVGPVGESLVIFLPAGDAKVAFTSREDLAIATSNLIAKLDISKNNIYKFVNSCAYNFYNIEKILSDIFGKEIKYIDADTDIFSNKLKEMGVPEMAIMMGVMFGTSMKNGEFSKTDTTLEQFIGKKPKTIEEFLEEVYGY